MFTEYWQAASRRARARPPGSRWRWCWRCWSRPPPPATRRASRGRDRCSPSAARRPGWQRTAVPASWCSTLVGPVPAPVLLEPAQPLPGRHGPALPVRARRGTVLESERPREGREPGDDLRQARLRRGRGGAVAARPAPGFRASFVLLHRAQNPRLEAYLRTQAGFVRVFDDGTDVVYRVQYDAGLARWRCAMTPADLPLEFVRVVERAAIEAARTMGQGERKGSDHVAVEAMRREMETRRHRRNDRDRRGRAGRGADALHRRARRARGNGPAVDIAVDPLEGTNLCATGAPGAIAVLAAAEQGGLLHAPDIYMEKLVVPGPARGQLDINAPVADNLKALARALDRDVDGPGGDRARPAAPRAADRRDPQGRRADPADRRRGSLGRDLGRRSPAPASTR